MVKIFSFILVPIFLTFTSGLAQEKSFAPPQNKGWSISIGTATIYSPAFLGAKDYALSLFPDLRVKYKDRFFASIPEGIGYNFKFSDQIKFGPLAKIRFSRNEENGGSPFQISGGTSALKGMGEVDSAIETGFFGEYKLNKFWLRSEFRKGFGGHQGSIFDSNLTYNNRLGPLSFGIGPRMTFANSSFIATYYGINSAQSAKAGLAQYKPSSGIVSYGLSSQLRMPLNKKVMLINFLSYDLLGKELKKSPLIQERGRDQQFSFGLALSYQFNLSK
jgi:outer membrane scaffolding protein for murein synthesis (MipA/OmpV family)